MCLFAGDFLIITPESGRSLRPMPLNVGSRLAHHDVTALIGEGGMGQVYRVRNMPKRLDVLGEMANPL